MVKHLACLCLVMLPLAACGDDDSGTGCVPADCTAQCVRAGYLTGTCSGDSCQCAGGSDADADGDADADADGTTDDGGRPPSACEETMEYSYIWIANTGEGTVSKLCTIDGVEVGRYWTSPQRSTGDPSRTSVNLYGDAVVTNRDTTGGPSSVTKFAALREDCIDRSGDGYIQTSTGGLDVMEWGEDECMLWNSVLNEGGSAGIGARATAWDGTENPETGEGGNVWIGAMGTGQVFKLDGNTGEILAQTRVTNQPYGGVIDGRGSFWIVGAFCTIGVCNLARVNLETMESTTQSVPCGYGISADSLGRIWTSGRTMAGSCVNRLDPNTGESTTYRDNRMTAFFRGIAVDNRGSVWVANTQGDVLQISEADVTLTNTVSGMGSEVVGVAIDFLGKVWAVDRTGNQAVRIDPATLAWEAFPVGSLPYTYSDMTGYQLRTVIFF
jgi:hypothetical protein